MKEVARLAFLVAHMRLAESIYFPFKQAESELRIEYTVKSTKQQENNIPSQQLSAGTGNHFIADIT